MITNPWSVELNAGAGGTTLDTDDFIDDGADSDAMTPLAETRPAEGPTENGIVVPLTLNLRWDLPMRTVTGT